MTIIPFYFNGFDNFMTGIVFVLNVKVINIESPINFYLENRK